MLTLLPFFTGHAKMFPMMMVYCPRL